MQPSDNHICNEKPEPQVVLMCGVSGSGKTHYALALESRGYRRLSADEIAWMHHGRDLLAMPLERQKEVFVQANEEVLMQLEHALEQKRKVVVDSTMCSRNKRDVARRLCRQFGVEPVLVYMMATRDVLRRRLDSRRGHGANDQPVSPARLECFLSGFQPPQPDENAMVIPQK